MNNLLNRKVKLFRDKTFLSVSMLVPWYSKLYFKRIVHFEKKNAILTEIALINPPTRGWTTRQRSTWGTWKNGRRIRCPWQQWLRRPWEQWLKRWRQEQILQKSSVISFRSLKWNWHMWMMSCQMMTRLCGRQQFKCTACKENCWLISYNSCSLFVGRRKQKVSSFPQTGFS